MNKIGISDNILETYSNEIEKYKNPKDFVLVAFLAAIGVGSGLWAMQGSLDSSSWLYNLLCILAFTGAVSAVVILLVNKKTYRYAVTRSRVDSFGVFCKNGSESLLADACGKENWKDVAALAIDAETGVRFDILVSRDRKFCVCRPMRYVPFDFRPITDFKSVDEASAMRLMEELTK